MSIFLPAYAFGARIPVFGLATRSGTSASGAGVVI